ncbi:hypothetical protein BDV93DRAFT_521567 [Ceratobasidium sp. AG-I]|nr:hypothetical protein BDV93DRAFT_521567 [Ceratobasidium sp. AG-I]
MTGNTPWYLRTYRGGSFFRSAQAHLAPRLPHHRSTYILRAIPFDPALIARTRNKRAHPVRSPIYFVLPTAFSATFSTV